MLGRILPTWLVVTMVGWKRALEVLPALLVSGGAFAAMPFYWSNYQPHDPGLVDIAAAIFSLLVMVALLRFWKPRHPMEEAEPTIACRDHGVGTIVVASTACRLEGREADVWKAVFWHSLVLASLVGLAVPFYAYVAPWMIPG